MLKNAVTESRLILGMGVLTLLVALPLQAAPPCDETKNFYQVGNTCYAFPVWDFTLRDTSSRIDHASYGEGTGGAAAGPSPDAGPAPDASPGPSADAGPDPAPDGGGDNGGDSGDSGGDGGGADGCAY